MQPDLHDSSTAVLSLQRFRQRSPFVHCITNDVVQTFTANVLLAPGASPAMVIDPQEAAPFAAMADALLINVGTLTRERAAAMRCAVDSAGGASKPWVPDPVAVSPLALCRDFYRELLVGRRSDDPGSFIPAFLDALYALSGEKL